MSLQPGKPTNEPTNYFAFAKQSAVNVEGTTFFFTKHLDGTGYDADIDVDQIREGGDGQEVGLRYKTMIKGDGNLVTFGRMSVAARLWHGILGVDSVGSAGVASLARHSAVPTSALPYYTIEQRHADNLERQSNVVFTSLAVEGEAGKPWRYSAAFVGGGTMSFRDVASALTPARETGRPVMYPYGSYVFDGGASYSADVTKWKIEVTRGVDDGIQTIALNRDDVVPLQFDVAVDATLKYTSKAYYQKVIYNGGSGVPPELATGSLELVQFCSPAATMAASAQARVVVPVVEWLDAKVNKLQPDGETVYLDLVGGGARNATYTIFAQHDNLDLSAY